MGTTAALINSIHEAEVLMLHVAGVLVTHQMVAQSTPQLISLSTNIPASSHTLNIAQDIPPSSNNLLAATTLLSSSGIKTTHMAPPSMALTLLRLCRLPTTIQTTLPRSTLILNTHNILSRHLTSQPTGHSSRNNHSSNPTANRIPLLHHIPLASRGLDTTPMLKVLTALVAAVAVTETIEAAPEVLTWPRLLQ